MRKQTKKYLEYKILITPDVRTGRRERCFTAFVPVLGIATSGDTIEAAFGNVKEMIFFHLESLRKERKNFPKGDTTEEFITTARVAVPA